MSVDRYYFLVSSLPLLKVGETAPFSSEHFLALCEQHISPTRLAQLERIGLVPDGQPSCDAEAQWQAWETYVRNYLVRSRTEKLRQPSEKWLRPEADVFPGLNHLLEDITVTDDPATRERDLDELRLNVLDSLTVRHEFGFEAVVAYRLKLLLIEKWAGLSREAGQEELEKLVTAGTETAEPARVITDLSG